MPLDFQKTLLMHFSSLMCATCPTHITLHYLIITVTTDKQYNS